MLMSTSVYTTRSQDEGINTNYVEDLLDGHEEGHVTTWPWSVPKYMHIKA